MSQTTTSLSTSEDVDKETRVKDILEAVAWSEMANRVCPLDRTESCEWGEVGAGRYNVVSFLAAAGGGVPRARRLILVRGGSRGDWVEATLVRDVWRSVMDARRG
ncbi:hypothetical protein JB92DRAFT_2828034 [Gautieria morchelliformis]|nr:hypothetical protein JB92DRAFT_2828034 [Gautieria morchelliformis]